MIIGYHKDKGRLKSKEERVAT